MTRDEFNETVKEMKYDTGFEWTPLHNVACFTVCATTWSINIAHQTIDHMAPHDLKAELAREWHIRERIPFPKYGESHMSVAGKAMRLSYYIEQARGDRWEVTQSLHHSGIQLKLGERTVVFTEAALALNSIHELTDELYTESVNEPPRNNDGLSMCYWCNVPTQKRGGGAYDVCPKCER